MSKRRHGQIVDVVRNAVAAAANEGSSTSSAGQRDGASGGRSQRECWGRTGGLYQRLEVARQRGVESNPLDCALELDEATWIKNGFHIRRAIRVAFGEKAHFDLRRRVANAYAEEESVELGLGQGIRAGEVLWVLGRNDEERLGQGNGLSVDGDLRLVHRFEQRRLGSRARSIDFVSEENVREDRALAKYELARALVPNGNAHHVARQKIACKLQAFEIASHGLCNGPRKRGLPDAGNVFDQKMAASEQRDESELDDVRLSFEGILDGVPELLDGWQLLGQEGLCGRHG